MIKFNWVSRIVYKTYCKLISPLLGSIICIKFLKIKRQYLLSFRFKPKIQNSAKSLYSLDGIKGKNLLFPHKKIPATNEFSLLDSPVNIPLDHFTPSFKLRIQEWKQFILYIGCNQMERLWYCFALKIEDKPQFRYFITSLPDSKFIVFIMLRYTILLMNNLSRLTIVLFIKVLKY